MALAEAIINKMESMRSRRTSWDSDLQEVADFFVPHDNQISGKDQNNQKRYEDLYDQTGIESLDTFVAGMYNNNTPPDARWFAIASSNDEMNQNEQASRWFNEITRITHDILAGSNFSIEIQNCYQNLGWAGRGTIFILEDSERFIKYRNLHYTESYIAEDKNGIVDTVYNPFEMTARAALQRWGDLLPGNIIQAAIDPKKADKKFKFIYAVFPRTDRDVKRADNVNFPWASVYVAVEAKQVIEESGFREKPFAVPRFWKDTKEVEGRSPAQRALPDVKLLNALALTILQKANMEADPAILIPSDDAMYSINTAPGSKIYYRPNQIGAKPEFLASGGNFQISIEFFNIVKNRVEKAFFVDFFALLSSIDKTTQRTAFEINERLQEKLDILSPSRGRLKIELLDPLITRTVNILLRQGVFPEMPDIVKNAPNFNIEYKGRLALLARSLQARSVINYADYIRSFVEMDPNILDNIDFDQVAEIGVDAFGVPSAIIKDKAIVQEEREQRAQQQQLMQAAEAAKSIPSLQKQSEQNSPAQAIEEAVQ